MNYRKFSNVLLRIFCPSPNVEVDTIDQYLELHPKLKARNEENDSGMQMKKDREKEGGKGKERQSGEEKVVIY